MFLDRAVVQKQLTIATAWTAARAHIRPSFTESALCAARYALHCAVDDRDSLDGSARPSLAIRDAPGAGLVLWAESAAGALELERPYARSATLDGGCVMVVVFAEAAALWCYKLWRAGAGVTLFTQRHTGR